MEFGQLRYFIAAANEGNVTAAARVLNVSQPLLTQQIRALEREIGHELFLRSTKGVRLTPAGEEFLTEGRRILDQADIAVARSRTSPPGGVAGSTSATPGQASALTCLRCCAASLASGRA